MKLLIHTILILSCLLLLLSAPRPSKAQGPSCIEDYSLIGGACWDEDQRYNYDPVGDPGATCIHDSQSENANECMANPPGSTEPEPDPDPPTEPNPPAEPPEPEQASSPCKEGYLLSTDGNTCYLDVAGLPPDTDYKYYDVSADPDGKCLLDEGETTSSNAEWDNCVTDAYTSPLEKGGQQLGQICQSVPSNRYLECMAEPDAYDRDPCFSPHTTLTVASPGGTTNMYDSTDCKVKRGQKECDKNKDKGWVYVRAFGQDPETSCVSFIGFTKTIINYAMLIAALIAGAMLLKGGFKYVVSRGSATALIEARDEILHASIGIAMLAIAYVAILFLQGSLGFLGVDLVGPFALIFAK